MKDYRKLSRYYPDDWENDDNWKAKRLDFIWCIRDYNFDMYMDLDLNEEKEDFYYIDNSNINRLASELHYSVDMKYYDKRFINVDIKTQYAMLQDLRKMMKQDIVEFMKKSNCNLYEYFMIKGQNGLFYGLR